MQGYYLNDHAALEGAVADLNRAVGVPYVMPPGVAHYSLDWFAPVKGHGRRRHAALVWVHTDGQRERVTAPARMRDAIPAVKAYAARIVEARAAHVL